MTTQLNDAAAEVRADGSVVTKSGRIPSLDGLRGVSVLLVMIGHWVSIQPPLAAIHSTVGGFAQLGVSAFFVISGFLITHLLLREKERTGSIDLRVFYLRRALRILPPVYVFLAVMGTLAALSLIDVPARNFRLALLFMADYIPLGDWIKHLWSLAVEEKFYLLWPVIMLARRTKLARNFAIAVIAAAPFIRVATYHFDPASFKNLGMFHVRMDMLMWGCVLALFWGKFQPNKIAALGGVMFLLLIDPVCQLYLRGAYLLPVGYTLQGFSLAAVVAYVVMTVPRSLNFGILPFVGTFSYSLYLWQEPFLVSENHAWIGRTPWDFIGALAVGWISFLLIEKPMTRLRNKIIDAKARPLSDTASA